ncbi:MAG: hypothetical protein IKZ57_02615 [Spirochaetia bacterium]|nr:hypothetical protein [Spirochaetia bacterium]
MNKTLDDMLVLITEENIYSEIDAGFPVGKEVLPSYSKNDIYDKLEEAKQDLLNGHYSSVEDAVERIKAKHGLCFRG